MIQFHVGQKVVFVDEAGLTTRERKIALYGIKYPDVSGTYIVREVLIWDGRPCIRLCEITNPKVLYENEGESEQAFAAWRFRPVIERKTDISIFTEMLNTQRTGVSA